MNARTRDKQSSWNYRINVWWPSRPWRPRKTIRLSMTCCNQIQHFKRCWRSRKPAPESHLFPDRRDSVLSHGDKNMNSVFDLSPSEKLQLVEDLWDDLAS